MVLELCRGGDLHHFIGETHYSGGWCWLGAGVPGRWLVLAVGAGWAGWAASLLAGHDEAFACAAALAACVFGSSLAQPSIGHSCRALSWWP
jgi:hypothetical protein